MSFDPVIQRVCHFSFLLSLAISNPKFSVVKLICLQIINDEDGGIHKRYASPSLRERGVQLSRAPSHATTQLPGYGTSAIVAMDKSATIPSEPSLSSTTLLLSQSKTFGKSSERSLESVLNASKQKVSAIESLLKGVSISDKQNFSVARSTSLDLGSKDNLFENLLVLPSLASGEGSEQLQQPILSLALLL